MVSAFYDREIWLRSAKFCPVTILSAVVFCRASYRYLCAVFSFLYSINFRDYSDVFQKYLQAPCGKRLVYEALGSGSNLVRAEVYDAASIQAVPVLSLSHLPHDCPRTTGKRENSNSLPQLWDVFYKKDVKCWLPARKSGSYDSITIW